MNNKNKGSMRQILACVVFIFAGIATAQEREWGVNREIVQISESVYRWGSDNQYDAYIAGSDGIAVVDGHYCPSGTMRWLKEQLAMRHELPVKYVILSHDHQMKRSHVAKTSGNAEAAIPNDIAGSVGKS